MKKLAIILALVSTVIAQAQEVSVFSYFKRQGGRLYPESITKDSSGNLYLSATFNRAIVKVDTDGKDKVFATVPANYLLGVTIGPDNNIYAVGADVSDGGGIWKIDTTTKAVTKYSDVTGFGTINDLAFGADGYLYVGDDTLNQIWRIDSSGTATVWSQDVLFSVTHPENYPFEEGVNGLTFSPNGQTLYVTNTSEGRIIAIDLDSSGNALPGRVIAEDPSLIGIDGIRSASNGDLYVANNIGNSIQKVTQQGVITTIASGGLLNFPTGLELSADETKIYVANNGDAFFGNNPERNGVLVIDLTQ